MVVGLTVDRVGVERAAEDLHGSLPVGLAGAPGIAVAEVEQGLAAGGVVEQYLFVERQRVVALPASLEVKGAVEASSRIRSTRAAAQVSPGEISTIC